MIDAFQLLSRTEGIIPALEPAHALAWVVAGPGRAGRAHRAAEPVGPRRQGRRPDDGHPRSDRRRIAARRTDDLDRARRAGRAGRLETALRAAATAGRKLLVPYVTGGLGDDWADVVRAIADAGADAIEIGIPFSDPVMDGPVIQAASEKALDAGATPHGILDELSRSTPAFRWRS